MGGFFDWAFQARRYCTCTSHSFSPPTAARHLEASTSMHTIWVGSTLQITSNFLMSDSSRFVKQRAAKAVRAPLPPCPCLCHPLPPASGFHSSGARWIPWRGARAQLETQGRSVTRGRPEKNRSEPLRKNFGDTLPLPLSSLWRDLSSDVALIPRLISPDVLWCLAMSHIVQLPLSTVVPRQGSWGGVKCFETAAGAFEGQGSLLGYWLLRLLRLLRLLARWW